MKILSILSITIIILCLITKIDCFKRGGGGGGVHQLFSSSNTTESDSESGSFFDYFLFGNAFVRGGIVVGLWTSVTAFLASGAWKLYSQIKQRMWTTVFIPQKETRICSWLRLQLSTLDQMQQESSLELGLRSTVDPEFRSSRRGGILNMSNIKQDVCWLPRENHVYRIVYRSRWLWIQFISPAPPQDNGYRRSSGQDETKQGYKIQCFGANKELIRNFVRDAQELYTEKMKKRTVIWSAASQNWGSTVRFQQLAARPSRPLNTVILPNDVGRAIVDDMRDFIDSEDWYYERGIPYRRGYLLYGPPGCGKTSFAAAAAGELRLTICILNLGSEALSDDTLIKLLSEAPKHAIILMEDIDAVFKPPTPEEDEADQQQQNKEKLNNKHSSDKKEPPFVSARKRTMKNTNGITFSGLLNAIDGVAAQEGKMLVMSTNHPERLDPALVRAGRVDVRVRFGLAPRDCIARLFERFYAGTEGYTPEQIKTLAQQYIADVEDEVLSMSQVQGHLMFYRKDPHTAVKNAHELHDLKHSGNAFELGDAPLLSSASSSTVRHRSSNDLLLSSDSIDTGAGIGEAPLSPIISDLTSTNNNFQLKKTPLRKSSEALTTINDSKKEK